MVAGVLLLSCTNKKTRSPQATNHATESQHKPSLDSAMHAKLFNAFGHTPVIASRTFAWSASARVCAAVMSHSDSVSGRGELRATTKGWNSGV